MNAQVGVSMRLRQERGDRGAELQPLEHELCAMHLSVPHVCMQTCVLAGEGYNMSDQFLKYRQAHLKVGSGATQQVAQDHSEKTSNTRQARPPVKKKATPVAHF